MTETDLVGRWYADLYDQEETDKDDVDFMFSIIGAEAQNILEACCGTGRILAPLAKVGHTVTGFDSDLNMLGRIPQKIEGLNNVSFFQSDAINDNWGSEFDTVILAGNILINIQTRMDYMEAQKLFIRKAYETLRANGHLYLDFNCFSNPEDVFGDSGENVVFEGLDSFGSNGKYTILDSEYERRTQTASFRRKTELITAEGRKIVWESLEHKHIPTLEQVHEWLDGAGFKILCEFGDYSGRPISTTTEKAIIWAVKN